MQSVEAIDERRSYKRYGIQLQLRWRVIRRRQAIESGTGRTIDMSTGGILFEADGDLPTGSSVELSIAWPMLLHKVAPLQLVVMGRIVRSNGGRVAIRMMAHEFRTRGVPTQDRQSLDDAVRTRAIVSYMKSARD